MFRIFKSWRFLLLSIGLAIFAVGCAEGQGPTASPSETDRLSTAIGAGGTPTETPDLRGILSSNLRFFLEGEFGYLTGTSVYSDDGQVGAQMPGDWDATSFGLAPAEPVNELLKDITAIAVRLDFATGQGAEPIKVAFAVDFEATVDKQFDVDYTAVRQKSGTDYSLIESFKRNLRYGASGCDETPPARFEIPVIFFDNFSLNSGYDVIPRQTVSPGEDGTVIVAGEIDEAVNLYLAMIPVEKSEWQRNLEEACDRLRWDGVTTDE